MNKFLTYLIFISFSVSQDLTKNVANYVMQKTDKEIILDGNVTEEEWGHIKTVPMGVSYPIYGKEKSQETKFYVTYDKDYVYVAVIAFDKEPAKIRRNTLKRDDWSSDDMVGIVFDTFNDNENASAFMVTPEGVRVDWAIFNDANSFGGEPFNSSWNTFWDAKAQTNNDGWSVEFRIPFSSLKFSLEGDNTTMGMLTFRYLPRYNEMQNYPMIPPKFDWGFIKPSLARDVTFSGISSKNPIYITPYVLSGSSDVYEDVLDDNDNTIAYKNTTESPLELGLDVKFNLTNNITADITFNTDFAQVEADNQQVNLSQFSLFFPEKRLFFQERSSLFAFSTGGPTSLFYSRQIGISEDGPVRILGGARIVGRVSDWDVGLINMQTEKSSEFSSENFAVLRAKRQIINPFSNAGMIFTSRLGENGDRNFALGIDASIRFGQSDHYFDFKIAQTFDNDSDYVDHTGFLENNRMNIGFESRTKQGFSYDLSYMRSGEYYNPGIGFVSRENFYGVFTKLAYGTIHTTESWFQNSSFYLRSFSGYSIKTDDSETVDITFGFRAETKNGASMNADYKLKQERIEEEFDLPNDVTIYEGYYKFHGFEASYNSPFSDLLRYDASTKIGTFYNGTIYTLAFGPKWAYNKHLNLALDYEYNNGQFDKRNEAFTVNIYRFKGRYAFNRSWVFSSFIQYNSDNFKSNINARLRFNPMEGTDVYLVYDETDNYNLKRELPYYPAYDNKTLILKVNYTMAL